MTMLNKYIDFGQDRNHKSYGLVELLLINRFESLLRHLLQALDAVPQIAVICVRSLG